MKECFEKNLLNSAIEIGEEIIAKASIDSNGIHWRTVQSLNVIGDLETNVDESIATGVSGILLFYIDLYKATNSAEYLGYIDGCGSWLINHCKKQPATHGFYAGRMGSVYALLQIADVTQHEYYSQQATEIAAQFKSITSVSGDKYCLYNGLAGSVWGLLQLYSKIKEVWILDAIYNGVEVLVQNIKSNGWGFYWDNYCGENRSLSTKPLCSMPLGASGVGLLFMYLSDYFSNQSYAYIAIEALKYEDQYFNEVVNNWPDFRIDVDQKNAERLKKAYSKGNYSPFVSKAYCQNWMFGLIGHIYPRLCANKFLSENYFDTIISLIEKQLQTNNIANELPNQTLATGKGGLGLLYLQLCNHNKNPSYFEKALALAKCAIDQKAVFKFYQFGFNAEVPYEDDSLLMGSAGIGYFFLKLLNSSVDSVLFPDLKGKNNVNLDHKIGQFNIESVVDTIAHSWYPSTIRIINSEIIIEKADLDLELLKKSLDLYVEQAVKNSKQLHAIDALQYDKFKLKANESTYGNYCFSTFCKNIEISKNQFMLDCMSRTEVMTLVLELNDEALFLSSKADWKNGQGNSPLDVEFEVHTLYFSGKDYTLTRTEFIVLNSFKKPQRVNRGYKIFKDITDKNNDPGFLLHMYFNVIAFFMSAGILICTKFFSVQKKCG